MILCKSPLPLFPPSPQPLGLEQVLVPVQGCQEPGHIAGGELALDVMHFSHPKTISPPVPNPSLWKNCLPRNWSLVSGRLGTAAPSHLLEPQTRSQLRYKSHVSKGSLGFLDSHSMHQVNYQLHVFNLILQSPENWVVQGNCTISRLLGRFSVE